MDINVTCKKCCDSFNNMSDFLYFRDELKLTNIGYFKVHEYNDNMDVCYYKTYLYKNPNFPDNIVKQTYVYVYYIDKQINLGTKFIKCGCSSII